MAAGEKLSKEWVQEWKNGDLVLVQLTNIDGKLRNIIFLRDASLGEGKIKAGEQSGRRSFIPQTHFPRDC